MVDRRRIVVEVVLLLEEEEEDSPQWSWGHRPVAPPAVLRQELFRKGLLLTVVHGCAGGGRVMDRKAIMMIHVQSICTNERSVYTV
jgi:hypothetical protein